MFEGPNIAEGRWLKTSRRTSSSRRLKPKQVKPSNPRKLRPNGVLHRRHQRHLHRVWRQPKRPPKTPLTNPRWRWRRKGERREKRKLQPNRRLRPTKRLLEMKKNCGACVPWISSSNPEFWRCKDANLNAVIVGYCRLYVTGLFAWVEATDMPEFVQHFVAVSRLRSIRIPSAAMQIFAPWLHKPENHEENHRKSCLRGLLSSKAARIHVWC